MEEAEVASGSWVSCHFQRFGAPRSSKSVLNLGATCRIQQSAPGPLIMTSDAKAPALSEASLRPRVSIGLYCPWTMVRQLSLLLGPVRMLTLNDLLVTNAIIHHCSVSPAPAPIRLSIPIPFIGQSLNLQVPLLKLPPNDTVFLPNIPYRPGYWLLDTPLRGFTERLGRRKYGLE